MQNQSLAVRVDNSRISPTIVVVPHLYRQENGASMAVALEEEEGEGTIKKEIFFHSDLAQNQHKEFLYIYQPEQP
ncbi:hypothetical protein OsI_16221 [Oryza sativa Indica Group]|uniref:Uncharacterized protein n=1 Tax=Oryza sativa subsp. indica TaxID=39946 RepID=B8AV32_ORYSI|nr:hypothetical protein OsI_16221 [Oryza sativa Indica Group]